MSVETLTIAPEYLSIYIAGRTGVDIPMHMDRQGIFASSQCINVPAYDWNHGDTNVTFGPFDELNETAEPAFDGFLETSHSGLLFLAQQYLITSAQQFHQQNANPHLARSSN